MSLKVMPLLILGDVNDVPDAQTSLIFNGDVTGRLDSIGEDPTARADELVPDHAPIVATFEI